LLLEGSMRKSPWDTDPIVAERRVTRRLVVLPSAGRMTRLC